MLEELLDKLRQRRYPVALIDIGPASLQTRESVVAEAFRCNLSVIDVRSEFLQGPDARRLGAVERRQLVEWMKQRSAQSGGVLVVNVDELLGSWDESEQVRFFKDFLQQEVRVPGGGGVSVPIVLVSARAELLDARWIDDKHEGCGLVVRV